MNTPAHSLRSARGFTLVEMMVVVAIAAILAGIAVPSMKRLVKSVQLTSATNELFSSFLLARSEAAKRHSRVALCKSADGTSCARTGGWEQGWIIFHDNNNTGTREASEELVWHAQALNADMRLTGNLNVARYISYAPNGETKLAGGAFQAGTITLCNQSGQSAEARQIILASGGRPRVNRTFVASCS